MRKLLDRAQGYSATEFYHEEHEMLDEINHMKKGVNSFSIYQPSYELKVPDLAEETKRIKEDLKLKLERYLKPIDNSFARDNFQYATIEMGNE
jgi:hypothetical protein